MRDEEGGRLDASEEGDQAAAAGAESDAGYEAGEDQGHAEQDDGEQGEGAIHVRLPRMQYTGQLKKTWTNTDSIQEIAGGPQRMVLILGSSQSGGKQIVGGTLQATRDTIQCMQEQVAQPGYELYTGLGLLLTRCETPAAGKQWCSVHGPGSHDSQQCEALRRFEDETDEQYVARAQSQLLAHPNAVNKPWVQRKLQENERGSRAARGGRGRHHSSQQRGGRGRGRHNSQQQGWGGRGRGSDHHWAEPAHPPHDYMHGGFGWDQQQHGWDQQQHPYPAPQYWPGYGTEWGQGAAGMPPGFQGAAGGQHGGYGAPGYGTGYGDAAGLGGGAPAAYAQQGQAGAEGYGEPAQRDSHVAAETAGLSRELACRIGGPPATSVAGRGSEREQRVASAAAAAAAPGSDGANSEYCLVRQIVGDILKHTAAVNTQMGEERRKAADRKRLLEGRDVEAMQGRRRETEAELKRQRLEVQLEQLRAENYDLRYRNMLHEGDR